MTSNTLQPTLMAFKDFGWFRGRADKAGLLRPILIGWGIPKGLVLLEPDLAPRAIDAA